MEKTAINPIDAIAESYCRNRLRYCHFAQRLVHNADAAEDIVAETFMRLLEKREEGEFMKFESYFYTALKNSCLNWLRDKQTQAKVQNEIFNKSYRLRQYDISSLDAFDPNQIYRNEIRDITVRQLKLLPVRTRNIFLDSRFNRLNHEEIAIKYDITKVTVKREIMAAVKSLRAVLKDYLPVILVIALALLSSL